MKTLNELRKEVGQWSRDNFGSQESKARPGLHLESLAPLMGIVEELGELEEAWQNYVEFDDAKDAIGDILIYLCDYMYREIDCYFPPLRYIDNSDVNYSSLSQIHICLGKLFHCTLKYHQGIRGIDNFDSYAIERDRCILELLRYLHKFTVDQFAGETLTKIINDTWENVVSKRDWKKDSVNG